MEPRQFFILFGILVSIGLLLTGLISLLPGKKAINVVKYPERAITIIVPNGPGASPDLMIRAMEKAAMKHLGQPLVVTNIPGGASTIGWNELAGAVPDGYTLGVTTPGVILQPLYGPTRYRYMSALEPLAQVVTLPVIAVVSAAQPWQNIAELVQYAKQHPGAIKFGHMGLGGPVHVMGEMLAKEAGIQLKQVPFSTSPDAVAALLGGHIQLLFMSTPELQEQIKSGRVRVLAVVAEERISKFGLQDIPTFKEQGLNVTFNIWHGIAAPKELPSDIKNKLAARLREIINDDEFQTYMENLGMTVEYLGPEECKYKWLAEHEQLSQFVKEHGIAATVAAQKY